MQRNKNVLIFPIEGDLNLNKVESITPELNEIINDGCKRIVLNFRDVEYIDSMGITFLIKLVKRLRDIGGRLSLTNVGDQVRRVLCITCLTDYMSVLEDGDVTIPALDPSIAPTYRTTVSINACDLEASRRYLQSLLHELPMNEDDIFDVTLACGEAISNAVDHGSTCDVYATITGYQDRVVIEVSDSGCGYDESQNQKSEIERGRGIKLMRLLCDSVSITKKEIGSGTVVRLIKLYKNTEEAL